MNSYAAPISSAKSMLYIMYNTVDSRREFGVRLRRRYCCCRLNLQRTSVKRAVWSLFVCSLIVGRYI